MLYILRNRMVKRSGISKLNDALIGFLNIEDNLDQLTKEDWYLFFEDEEIEAGLKAEAETFEKH